MVHKMTGTTKLAFFLSVYFRKYDHLQYLGAAWDCWRSVYAAFKLSKINYREVRFMMIFMLVFLLLNNLFILLFDPNQGTTPVWNETCALSSCSGDMM